jgi:ribosomal protein L11 methyltransferase
VTASAADATGWVRVTITIEPDQDPAAAEIASDVLWTSGAAGVEEQTVEGDLVLSGGFADPADAASALTRAVALGLAAASAPVDDDGLDGWREWAVPERAGRFWITPPWVDAPPLAAGEEVLWIDPGPTFGSGSHPTTRLVLALLADLVDEGATVLDAGCGSGVLAVGAARCGAASVLATDIDPASPDVVMANADRNRVRDRVQATTATLGALAAEGPRFSVVAANLLAPVIAEVGPDLVRCLAPDGRLVVSGLLADRWEATLPAVAPLAAERVVEEQGWVAVVLR